MVRVARQASNPTDEEDARIAGVGRERQQIALEQGEMDEARRGGDQQHGDGDVPGRSPSRRDGAAGEPGGAAAEETGDQTPEPMVSPA